MERSFGSKYGKWIALTAVVLALVLWFGGREAIAGRLTGGELIAFLLSEKAAYLTGALINIDGGTDF